MKKSLAKSAAITTLAAAPLLASGAHNTAEVPAHHERTVATNIYEHLGSTTICAVPDMRGAPEPRFIWAQRYLAEGQNPWTAIQTLDPTIANNPTKVASLDQETLQANSLTLAQARHIVGVEPGKAPSSAARQLSLPIMVEGRPSIGEPCTMAQSESIGMSQELASFVLVNATSVNEYTIGNKGVGATPGAYETYSFSGRVGNWYDTASVTLQVDPGSGLQDFETPVSAYFDGVQESADGRLISETTISVSPALTSVYIESMNGVRRGDSENNSGLFDEAQNNMMLETGQGYMK